MQITSWYTRQNPQLRLDLSIQSNETQGERRTLRPSNGKIPRHTNNRACIMLVLKRNLQLMEPFDRLRAISCSTEATTITLHKHKYNGTKTLPGHRCGGPQANS